MIRKNPALPGFFAHSEKSYLDEDKKTEYTIIKRRYKKET